MFRHRFPIGDIEPHYASVECPCRPSIYEGDHYDLCFHHAFDGREIVISVEMLLGMRCEDCGQYINEKGEPIPVPPPHHE